MIIETSVVMQTLRAERLSKVQAFNKLLQYLDGNEVRCCLEGENGKLLYPHQDVVS